MRKDRKILSAFSENADVLGEGITVQTVVEIAGDSRVLIENHYGVTEYSASRIGVSVRYGNVYVCGCELKLMQMTKEQLVISGKINSVIISRREDG